VIVKGSPEQSLLFQKVSARVMPPAIYGQKVPDAHIETLKRWIAAGAPSDQASGVSSKEAAGQLARFDKEILPMFTARCVECHGAGKPMAGLDLRTAAAALKGSHSGPVIVEGFSERSLLIRKVASHSMPPPGSGQPLIEPEIRTLREWIDRGHFTDGIDANSADRPFTKLEAPDITAEQRQFWAFRKPIAAALPKPRSASRVRTPIDGFLLTKLESQGLGFSADAANSTLMRRAYFDLTGLPPTAEEIRTFLSDTRSDAYERLLDRLLESPRHGERWGRQWLDAAGYVDTTGKDFDPTKTEYAEGMWHYRDYVIHSINQDKPWDQFLTEQIAGDEMVDWRSAKQFTPKIVELLTATGYLRNILDITEEDISNLPVERYEALFKLVEKVSSSTLGLTVGCARCHSHKFDPIPQRDYYRLLSIFATSYNPTDWLQPQNRYLWSVSKEEKEQIDRYNAEIDGPVGELSKQLAALRKPYQQRILGEKLKLLPEAIREDARAAVETPKEKRDDIQKYLFGKFGASLQAVDAEVAKRFTEADRATADKLETQIRTWNGYRRKLEKLQALWDVGAPPSIRLLQRGSADSPGPGVKPGFLEVLCAPGSSDAVRPKETQGKTAGLRLAFAQWLTSRENPLAARVIVNRIWQGHFGAGIVATADNFGKMGTPPANQALLDWLAVDFMEHGWKAKRLHKAIMMSTAYRQSARQGGEPWLAKARIADPENRLLWRMNLRRLDAETLRDSLIAVAGKLDTTMGGPPIKLAMQPDGLQVVSRKEAPASQWRRSIYLTARRNYPLTFLNVFDYPAIDTNCTRRVQSATPLQSLTMMNDPFTIESAAYLVARVGEMVGSDAPAAKRIEVVYPLVFARKPNAAEIQWGETHLKEQLRIYVAANEPVTQASAKAFLSLAQMLLSSNEFLYVD
jgi:mono/diheme cytochrome c family protein